MVQLTNHYWLHDLFLQVDPMSEVFVTPWIISKFVIMKISWKSLKQFQMMTFSGLLMVMPGWLKSSTMQQHQPCNKWVASSADCTLYSYVHKVVYVQVFKLHWKCESFATNFYYWVLFQLSWAVGVHLILYRDVDLTNTTNSYFHFTNEVYRGLFQ